MLDIIDRLATYGKDPHQEQIKSALFYPISVIVVAIVVVWDHDWVIPAFAGVLTSGPTCRRPR
jgi:type II secretory pathway component PulF